jgi:hypothetical protein
MKLQLQLPHAKPDVRPVPHPHLAAGCYIRGEVTGVLGNYKLVSASGEPINVASGLRQCSVYLSTQSF